jgi:hypothetical protein
MPTPPISPARVRLLPGLLLCVAGIPARQGACSGSRPCAPGPAVVHRVADRWLPPPFTTTARRRLGPGSAGRACPTLGLAYDASLSPGHAAVLPPLRPQHAEAGTAPVNDRVPPLLVPRSSSNLQHRPDGTPVDPWFSYCRACATGPMDFAPAHPIAGGSGGRSQRSLP